jgi:hypothetical protein
MKPKLLVPLIAVLNLAGGAAFGFVLGRAHPHAVPSHDAAAHDPDLPSLAGTLGLPPERDAKVRAILASCGPRFDEVTKDVRPKLRALHDQLVAELSQVLTPAEMERLGEEYRKRYGTQNPLEAH